MAPVPLLEKLKTEPCSLEEIQYSLVKLIECHNTLVNEIAGMLERGQIRPARDALMSRRFTL